MKDTDTERENSWRKKEDYFRVNKSVPFFWVKLTLPLDFFSYPRTPVWPYVIVNCMVFNFLIFFFGNEGSPHLLLLILLHLLRVDIQ